MSSAARSADAPTTVPNSPRAAVLSGSVSVCVDRPLLSLDRPFTYELPAELGARVGSLVRVPFHGRLVRAWVLGPTDDVPERVLKVRDVVSPIPFFDQRGLALFRRVSDRYVTPLAAVIGRAVPPRVASEERDQPTPPSNGGRRGRPVTAHRTGPVGDYRNGTELVRALADGGGMFVVRPGPADEAAVAVGCVRAALAGGRSAIVVVPDADPVPATAEAIADAVGEDAVLFLGGDKRGRYRTWLDIAGGRYRVVVGTRPAVFAPLRDLGLVYVHREAHPQHRDERSPSYHAREVAAMRAEVEGAVVVLSAFCPSLEAAARDHVLVEPAGRPWAPVEVVRPGPEGRSPRLVRALRVARRAFLFEPVRGYGVARVCRSCGEPAACASCLGTLRLERGEVRCVVCEAPGRCASCGASDFGVVRRGAERVEEWARSVASVPVSLLGRGNAARPPFDPEVLVGGLDALKDLGPETLDLIGILNADASLHRPGVDARERALVWWFEAAAWARREGRVIVQTNAPNDPAIQALVSGRPARFHRAEAPRRAEAGFPVGSPVFRVIGGNTLEAELRALSPRTLLVSGVEGATICLVVLDPDDLGTFGAAMRRLALRNVVTRVEAEPHL
jgi:primosomal protein N' (replication factor Y) (superfamily II helicase)